jgi:hypothetical protein
MFRCRDIVGIPPPVTLNPFVRKYVVSEGYVAYSRTYVFHANGQWRAGGGPSSSHDRRENYYDEHDVYHTGVSVTLVAERSFFLSGERRYARTSWPDFKVCRHACPQSSR